MKINLPPIQQEKTYTCLPACLRIVLHYLGTSLTEGEIADACNTTEAGTTLADAIHAVHSLGFNATRIQNATLEDLIHYLSHHEPVIVLVGVEYLPYGDFGTHAVIVCSLRSPTPGASLGLRKFGSMKWAIHPHIEDFLSDKACLSESRFGVNTKPPLRNAVMTKFDALAHRTARFFRGNKSKI